MQMIASQVTHEESFQPDPPAVLVVGYGFIGRHMAGKLAGEGLSVTVLNRSEPERRDPDSGVDVLVGDAADPEVLGAAITGVSHVIWCAGGLMPSEAETNPEADRDLTLRPLRTLLSLDALTGKSLTYISSGGTIYGNPDVQPVSEDQAPEPIGAYGRNKLLAEELLLEAAGSGNFRLRILRCANVYGPGQPSDRSQGAVAVFSDRISRGLPVQVFGDGGVFRDFVHVEDVVHATVRLWKEDGPVVLNCGSGRPVTIASLVEILEVALGRQAVIDRQPAREFDVDGIVLDLTRIRDLIDFDPVDLQTGLGVSLSLGAR